MGHYRRVAETKLPYTVLLMGALASAEDTVGRYVQGGEAERVRPIVAVDNVCAWPNLTSLTDGTIVATIHNQPSHLKLPADVDCWASEDGGRTWEKRGTPAPRDNKRVARGNVAAGLAGNGDLIVIASGWSDPTSATRGTIMPPIVSRSSDGGFTWTINREAFPDEWPEFARSEVSPRGHLVPFGDIQVGADGSLGVGFYGGGPGATFVYRSHDDGKTWCDAVPLNKEVVIHEPALFHLGQGRWLAAARLDGLNLHVSEDDATSWTHRMKLTGPQRHPGHFTRLKDGAVLLTYGNRLDPRGVDVLFSDDEGATWSEPFRVLDFQGDGGYPSSVQLPDGRVLTAYYARRIAGHDRYHMGVASWDPAEIRGR